MKRCFLKFREDSSCLGEKENRLRQAAAKKLRSRAGESIAETLVAVLIIAVALTMLASMISTTSDLVMTSKRRMGEYYTANSNLEKLEDTHTELTITIKDDKDVEWEEIPGIYQKNETFSQPVIAYRSMKTDG